jgi:L-ascorbate metabolism protein UlaG (beta-lactamase superfamily)
MTTRALFVPGEAGRPRWIEETPPATALLTLLRCLRSETGMSVNRATFASLSDAVSDAPVFTEAPAAAPEGRLATLIATCLDRVTALEEAYLRHLGHACAACLDGMDAAQAWWRRAEGVRVVWDLAAADAALRVARTAWGPAGMRCPRVALPIWSALGPWKRAADVARECGLPTRETSAWLTAFAEQGLAWYADREFPRTLPGAALDVGMTSAPLALNECVTPEPLFHGPDGVRPLPFMPRRPDVDGRTMVGVRFEFNRRGRVVSVIDLHGGPDTGGALRHLIPLLDGRRDARAIVAALPDAVRAAGRRALAAMGSTGALEAAGEGASPWCRAQAAAPTVTWLGHASVLAAFGETRIWCDPLVARRQHEADVGQPVPASTRGRPPVTMVLITHGDNDHCNASALLRVGVETPVLCPDTTDAGPWQVDMPGMLAALGFTDVRPVRLWQTTRIGDVDVTALPFEGEDWGLTLATCTWLLEGRGAARGRVYLSADAAGMLDVAARIGGAEGIDFACLGVSGDAEAHLTPAGLGYGHLYANWIPAARRARFGQFTNGPVEAAFLAERLGARQVFGYAAGGPGYGPMQYSDDGSHDGLAECLRARASTCVPVRLEPGVPFAITPPPLM